MQEGQVEAAITRKGLFLGRERNSFLIFVQQRSDSSGIHGKVKFSLGLDFVICALCFETGKCEIQVMNLKMDPRNSDPS